MGIGEHAMFAKSQIEAALLVLLHVDINLSLFQLLQQRIGRAIETQRKRVD